jgi:hypothetical protein
MVAMWCVGHRGAASVPGDGCVSGVTTKPGSSITSTGTRWPARRKHGRKGAEGEEEQGEKRGRRKGAGAVRSAVREQARD